LTQGLHFDSAAATNIDRSKKSEKPKHGTKLIRRGVTRTR
jgi:hypothetical protein